MTGRARVGATSLPGGRCAFRVWAPLAKSVEVHLLSPSDRLVPLAAAEAGCFEGVVEGAGPGARYLFRLDGKAERPDPASRSQPEGVHGPSEVPGDDFPWTDSSWKGRPWEELVFYELHTGLFTPEGTFESIIPRLEGLAGLGVTAVELMPVAQFPGRRNWGYDGVYPFAVQNSYGGAAGLKRLVDACHALGMAAALDVVYNHLGPEGNYLWAFGPYFTDRYKTPWGSAVNFDGPGSDEVRRYFLENALQWVRDFHFDVLRLDALHAIVDPSARPFLEELADGVRAEASRLGRQVYLVAEVDRNDPRFLRPPESGGFGLDAQWNDDFHHSLHTLLTGEREGYYRDFGTVGQMAAALAGGYVYTGQYSEFRGRRHGRPASGVRPGRMVVFSQNHDQVGNRMLGERLAGLVDLERRKLAAGAVLLAPGVPLLFMGEEYGETAPFLYFVDHSDPGLIEAVRKGRREEFEGFGWAAETPDPQSEETFERSRPDPGRGRGGAGEVLARLYRTLLSLRRAGVVPGAGAPSEAAAFDAGRTVVMQRGEHPRRAVVLFHFGPDPAEVRLAPRGGTWRRILDSADPEWMGPGGRAPAILDLRSGAEVGIAPWSFVAYAEGPAAVGGGGKEGA